jgi:hypothetical protein
MAGGRQSLSLVVLLNPALSGCGTRPSFHVETMLSLAAAFSKQ